MPSGSRFGMQNALYHYCSTEAFYAIVANRTVRLSAMTLSNDSLEGKLVSHALQRLAKRDSLGSADTERLLSLFASYEQAFEGLAFCLSEEGDLLSQWRGYASDATGVSIGFSRQYLEWLAQREPDPDPVQDHFLYSLSRVKYEVAEHDAEVEAAYQELRRHIDDGAFKSGWTRGLLDTRTESEFQEDQKKITVALSRVSGVLFSLMPKLFVLKSRAFREEKEWRLLSHLVWTVSDECSFRPAGNRLIPFRAAKLLQFDGEAIAEVVLGPKHLTPTNVVANFLKKFGFGEVRVRRSEATYR